MLVILRGHTTKLLHFEVSTFSLKELSMNEWRAFTATYTCYYIKSLKGILTSDVRKVLFWRHLLNKLRLKIWHSCRIFHRHSWRSFWANITYFLSEDDCVYLSESIRHAFLFAKKAFIIMHQFTIRCCFEVQEIPTYSMRCMLFKNWKVE